MVVGYNIWQEWRAQAEGKDPKRMKQPEIAQEKTILHCVSMQHTLPRRSLPHSGGGLGLPGPLVYGAAVRAGGQD